MDTESEVPSADPLDPESSDFPSKVQEVLRKGQHSWLKSVEVCDLLQHHSAFNLQVAKEPPCQPPGGSLFLFDRKAVRFFRKDKHDWRKKADGKTVRETHEKLKVDNVDMLNCYYAHANCENGLQRRCYWLLESDVDIVLVHYLKVPQKPNPVRVSTRLLADRPTRRGMSSPEVSPDSDNEVSADPPPIPGGESSIVSKKTHKAVHDAVTSFPEIPMKSADLYERNLSCMSFDKFLAAMDISNQHDKLPTQATKSPAPDARSRLSEERHLGDLTADTYGISNSKSMSPSLNTHSLPYSTGMQATQHGAADLLDGNTLQDHGKVQRRMSMHELTAARWRSQSDGSDEGSAHLQHLARMRKRTRLQPEQSKDHDTSQGPSNVYSPSASHLSDNELSWSLTRNQGKTLQDQLPIYNPASSAMCSLTQATSQPQRVAEALGNLSPRTSQQSMHLQIMSQQLLLGSLGSQDLLPHAEAFGQLPIQLPVARHQDSPLHQQTSHSPLHPLPSSQPSQYGQMSQSLEVPSFSSQLQRHEVPTSSTMLNQRHAFERPDGLSSFSLPFMNAPHAVQNNQQTSDHAHAYTAAGVATPMDICQPSSFTSTSTTNADVWQRAVASAAQQTAPPHLKRSINLVFQAGGTVGEYAQPPHKVSPFAVEKASLASSADGAEHLQHAPHSLPETQSSQGAVGLSDWAALSQRPSRSEALRKAALSLNAQLALIDKQVLQHVIPQMQQSTNGLQEQDIAEQVHACEEQLRQLELKSQHLVQRSAQEDSAAPDSSAACSAEQAQPGGQSLPSTSGASQQPSLQRLSQSASSAPFLFDRFVCGPAWAYSDGTSQILVAASVLDDRTTKDPGGQMHVMFDHTEVPATLLWPGVWRCEAPTHVAGTVSVCMTDKYSRRCSQSVPFEYRAKLSSRASSCTPRLGSAASERYLQLELMQLLLQQQPTGAISSSHASAGRITLPEEALHQQGAPGMTRDQVLQVLVKMELEGLLNQAAHPAKQPWTVETGHSGRLSAKDSAGTPVAATVSSTTEHGLSLLHLTAGLGYDWAARMLLRRGADIHLQGPQGFTALHWAASRGHEACVAMLLARGGDPNLQTQPTDGTPASTAADLASQAGHMGIAAFLAESSLVRSLTKLRQIVSERPLPQLASTPLPNRSPLLRKRGRLEHIPEAGPLEPPSGLVPLHGTQHPPALPAVASCPDHILDSLAAMDRAPLSTSAHRCQGPACMMQPLSALLGQTPLSSPLADPPLAVPRLRQTTSAGNMFSTTGVTNGVHSSFWAGADSVGTGMSQNGRAGCNPVALVAAAKQAAVVLDQQWQKREQHHAASAQRQAKHKQREEAALSRLNDSDKMWAMLKRIAQQECADGANPPPDSVLLRFLSLAPRVSSLNAAVKAALCGPIAATPSMQGDLQISQPDAHVPYDNGSAILPSGLPSTRSAPVSSTTSKTEVSAIIGSEAASLAVRHVEAILGNADACAQYDRLKSAVRGTRSQTSMLPGNTLVQAV